MQLVAKYKNGKLKSASAVIATMSDDIYPGISQKLSKVLKKELDLYLREVASELSKRHSGAWPGGTTATTLSSRSGGGIKSITRSVRVTGTTIENIVGRIGGDHYLRTQEYGAVIRPKRAKYLTIPLPAAMDSRGVPKKRSAREWSNTFVARSKKGNLLIFQKTGRNSIVPLYALKESVYIPPRLGMRRALENRGDKLRVRIHAALKKTL